MTQKLCHWCLGSALLLLSLHGLAAGDQPTRQKLQDDAALSQFIPFDEHFDAARSLDALTGKVSEAGRLEPGVVGKALSFEGSQNGAPSASYSVKESFDPTHGTMMFWFRPGWDGEEKEGKYTLAWVTMSGSERYFAIHRSFSPNDPQALFANFHWDNVLQSRTQGFFQKGQWIHVAVTWSEEQGQFALYFDGNLIADKAWAPLPAEGVYSPGSLRLGRFYAGEKGDDAINAAYDEFYLFKRSLSPAELKAYVEETAPMP